MMKRVPSFLPPIVAAGLAVAGCSAQVDPHYRGEPLATIEGSVVTQGEAGASNVDAAIVWMTSHSSEVGYTTKIVGSRIPVTGAFPARFTLNVFTPPPKEGEMLVDVGTSKPDYKPTGVWVGMIVALDKGANDADVHPRDVVGTDLGHLVFYFDHDASASPASVETSTPETFVEWTAALFNVSATKGFHLAMNDQGTPQAEAAYDQCRWGGVCERRVGLSDPVHQHMEDWDYARCTKNMPSAPTCTSFGQPASPAEEAEDERCFELAKSKPAEDCAVPWSHPPNPHGFSDPVTVVLGKSIWDLWLQ